MSYKDQKEAFVTGHQGTTPWEVLLVCLSAPIGLACFQRLLSSSAAAESSFLKRTILEASMVWFPMVLCQTKFLYPYGVFILSLQASISLVIKTNDTRASANTTKLDFLTAYRSTILYLTFTAILAVDFHVFPRRFAKTEVTGYGLMDVGAASFCFSAGLVSRLARLGKSGNLNPRIIMRTLPLVILGLLRIITNKELEYQEHVSEYGVSWNFFFTMGIIAIAPPIVPNRGTWALPGILMTIYQIALSFGGVQQYIETASRTCGNESDVVPCIPFFAANREGILGCIGYLSLYFMGEYVGLEFLWKRESLWKLTAIVWAMFGSLAQTVSVSRRSTNASFCLWATAHNLLILALCQTFLTGGNIPIIFETVNKHGLPMFLIANLLTGLVNLTIPTLEVGNLLALIIIFGYICLIGMVAILLDTVIGKTKGTKKEKSS